MRRAAFLVAISLAAYGAIGSTVAKALLWTTGGAPASDVTLSFVLTTPQTVGTTGSLVVTGGGTVNVTPTSLTFTSATFSLSPSSNNLLDAGDLGTAEFDFVNVEMSVVSSPISVVGGTWDLDARTPRHAGVPS